MSKTVPPVPAPSPKIIAQPPSDVASVRDRLRKTAVELLGRELWSWTLAGPTRPQQISATCNAWYDAVTSGTGLLRVGGQCWPVKDPGRWREVLADARVTRVEQLLRLVLALVKD